MTRVSKSLNTSLIAATVCGIIVTAIVALGAKPIIMMFLSPDTEAFRLAYEGLPKFALCGLFFALNIAMIGFYQSLEQSTRATVFTLLRGIIFIVPLFLILPHLIGTPGMWFAIPASELLTLIVIAIDFASNRHKRKTCRSANTAPRSTSPKGE